MKIFALTGGIATGKTTVGDMFVALGVRRIDADQIVHELYAHDPLIISRVRAAFGDSVVSNVGVVDRAALTEKFLQNFVARQTLEAIVHPQVVAVMAAQQADARRDGVRYCCCDVPLLFETGLAAQFSTIVVAACSPQTQVRRVMARYRCDADAAHARIALQWPLAEKILHAQHVVSTDDTIVHVRLAVEKIFAQL